ncbi:MAG: hypothetical protein J0H66_04450 [Solirubrobacterales bacterium]|nr:hypothetical protein [Solirubrobacterales bacterium]OJU94666.1 MAG: hypothetical protein BGO23_04560 [Solirubrobacterales bacterium 67-14]
MKTKRRERIAVLATAVLALFAVSLPATASAKDRNKDKIPDRWERTHKLSLKRDQRKLDQDKDGLRNRAEWRAGTNPRDKDSDDDGVSDLKEKAGVISAYDEETGELTLTLYAGGELTGSVTDQTRVKCESEEASTDDESTDGESGDEAEAENFRGSGGTFEDESGEDRDGHGGRGEGCGGDCSVEDLAKGVEVTEAVIKYTASGKVFKELEIVASADE